MYRTSERNPILIVESTVAISKARTPSAGTAVKTGQTAFSYGNVLPPAEAQLLRRRDIF
jgi:hypothetical protein